MDIFSADLVTVGILVVLEGLLSCDNAVVLAVLVKDLPEDLRGKALRYGIFGAYAFRVAAILLATAIMSVWWLKVAGGAYLVFMSAKFFLARKDEDHDGLADRKPVRRILGLSAFWSTVVAVELTDIVFSVDSIAAAVALSSKVWVLIAGGFLGILAMRFAAQGFVGLLKRFPAMEGAAFAAVALIGLKLCLEIPADVFSPVQPVAAYSSAATYAEAAHAAGTHLLEIPHVLAITARVPAAPELAPIAAGVAAAHPAATAAELARLAADEHARALAQWSLGLRPLVHIDGLAASGLVALVIASGFCFRRRDEELETESA